MAGNLDEKTVKEVLKKIIENNNNIPYKAKVEIKAIIELEHNPEKLLQECLLLLPNIKIQTMLLSWLRTGCVITPQSHFWVCGNRFIIPILNLSNSIGLKRNREIMYLH